MMPKFKCIFCGGNAVASNIMDKFNNHWVCPNLKDHKYIVKTSRNHDATFRAVVQELLYTYGYRLDYLYTNVDRFNKGILVSINFKEHFIDIPDLSFENRPLFSSEEEIKNFLLLG